VTPTLLLVNKFYHDQGLAGGVGRYLLQEEEDLTAAGWKVVPFAIADADARPSPWSESFVRAHDYSAPRWSMSTFGDALSLIWNREAASKLDRLILTTRPQVAHLHNIYHHLSPSILPVLARHGIPVLMTLHDLRLLCPAIHMLRQGQVCERCQGGHFYEAVLGRCVKESRAASVLAAIETWHQRKRRLYERHVTRFICPSRFYLEKFAAWGFPQSKLIHLPNFVDSDLWRPAVSDPEHAYLYFGRISAEKGLATLLQAQALWEAQAAAADVPILRVAGSGPWQEQLQHQAAGLRLQRYEFLGPLPVPALQEVVSRSLFTVIPSQWYENAPMALLESLAAARPVVGADIGGIPELIDDGRDGVLFPPGDAAALQAALARASSLGPGARRQARAKAEQAASRTRHMQRLQEIIADLVKPAAE